MSHVPSQKLFGSLKPSDLEKKIFALKNLFCALLLAHIVSAALPPPPVSCVFLLLSPCSSEKIGIFIATKIQAVAATEVLNENVLALACLLELLFPRSWSIFNLIHLVQSSKTTDFFFLHKNKFISNNDALQPLSVVTDHAINKGNYIKPLPKFSYMTRNK